jgi:hypothetical protein
MSATEWDTAVLRAAVSEREAELRVARVYGTLRLRQRFLAWLLGV